MILAIEILFIFYFLLVIILIIGWRRATSQPMPAPIKNELFISVVIPARNEKKCIQYLLDDIKLQQYTAFEVLVIDDHSEDETFEIVVNQSGLDGNFVILQNSGIGKKKAITTGVEAAQGTIIVTTDADCRVGENWLQVINQCFQNDAVKMAFGGVKIIAYPSFFSSLQILEFSSLIGSGVATWAWGFPTMCNGANLAFRRNIFHEVGGYDGNLHVPSGDDEFLLRSIAKKYSKGICFINDERGVIGTQAHTSLKAFIHQRIRWAGKWRFHKTFTSSLLAVFIFVFQLSSVALIIASLLGHVAGMVTIGLLAGKYILEFFFLKQVSRFLHTRWSWLSFILLQGVYPLYILFIGVISNFKSFEWKGRRLKSIQLKPIND
jgi:cellulose synthase/poly-beta-1,6-N-acetylglucosamine synthase-like glycosyltransferase